MCDPTWQVTLSSSEVSFHEKIHIVTFKTLENFKKIFLYIEGILS